MGRPREPDSKISKWAHWKRGQRATPTSQRRCSRCGKKGAMVDLHHRNNEQADNRPANIVQLCRSCHTAVGNAKAHVGRH